MQVNHESAIIGGNPVKMIKSASETKPSGCFWFYSIACSMRFRNVYVSMALIF